MKHPRTGRLAAAAVLTLSCLVVAGALWLFLHPEPEIVQGEVDATQIDVSPKIPGRVASLEVRQGDSVVPGQLLATLDSPEIRAKLRQASAARDAAKAQRDKAYRGAREEEIRAAQELWTRAEAAAELARKTFDRVRRLHEDGVLPIQKRDEAEAQWKASRAAADAAKAAYDMAVRGARIEDKEAAAALVDQASGAIDEVESFLAETRLTAPVAGEVVDLVVDPGELVAPGYPVLTLVDLSDIWVTFHLREDRLSRIRMGDLLDVRIPALGNRTIEVRISYLSPLGDFATWRATNASGDFDLKTFEVRARPTEPVQGLRPGMSALLVWPDKGPVSKPAGSGPPDAR